ncbi:MAG: DUF1080 domain-containing protein [Planctomycetes bacterium]|nr:DUF1080 domain-containing protein [Planctomycetota bacterium]
MQHKPMLAISLLVCLAGTAVAADLRFKDASQGVLPAGWTAAKTGEGKSNVWKIVADESSPDDGKALAQVSADGPRPLFNLCVADKPNLKDVELTVAVKAVAGKIDQGGGPVWRYQDANNYYIARVNPLENNYRVYKVVKGQRTELDSADMKAAANKWHTIRIVHEGERIRCYLNGKLHLEVTDNTFQKAGKIGLWTKADAQTRFAGVKVSGK